MFVANSNPYPWPFDGGLDSTSVALVICGAQRDLVGVSRSAATVFAVLDDVAAAVRRGGGVVVWLRHGSALTAGRSNASLPRRGTSGWALIEAPHARDIVVDASGWDGCYASDLDHVLRSSARANVILGGFASELTVDSTVRTLNDRGHECLVLTDGCAPLDAELGARAHHSLTMSGGIFGALGASTEVLAALFPLAPPAPPIPPTALSILESETIS